MEFDNPAFLRMLSLSTHASLNMFATTETEERLLALDEVSDNWFNFCLLLLFFTMGGEHVEYKFFDVFVWGDGGWIICKQYIYVIFGGNIGK